MLVVIVVGPGGLDLILIVDCSCQMTLISRVIRMSTSSLSYGLVVERDIHEKREARKHKIASLKIEIESTKYSSTSAPQDHRRVSRSGDFTHQGVLSSRL
jgi:hypothetical protein